MKLSRKAIKAITTKAKSRLALEMDCSIYTIERWIKDNENNGDLTKARLVQIISEEIKMTPEKILEKTEADVIAK